MEIIKCVCIILVLIKVIFIMYILSYMLFLEFKKLKNEDEEEWFYNEYKRVNQENKQLRNDFFELSQEFFNNQKQK